MGIVKEAEKVRNALLNLREHQFDSLKNEARKFKKGL
jgi:hypothetical protein